MNTLDDLIPSWTRSLKAANKSARTVKDYTHSADLFAAYVGDVDVRKIDRATVEDFIDGYLERTSASTAATHYRRLQQLFRWLVDEEEVDESPMRRMSPPKIPEKSVPVIAKEDMRALLVACKGPRFEDRRDEAIVRVLIDTGVRVSSLINQKPDDVDFEYQTIDVTMKGGKLRAVPFGSKTMAAIDRYLRKRRHQRHADEPWLWIGKFGRLTDWGVRQMLDRRCERAKIGHIHPHQFRHTAAHEWMLAEGSEGDLERLMGWSPSSGMTKRYGASAADQRAREAHRRLGLADRL